MEKNHSSYYQHQVNVAIVNLCYCFHAALLWFMDVSLCMLHALDILICEVINESAWESSNIGNRTQIIVIKLDLGVLQTINLIMENTSR